jgi:iron complex transport system substrate-binding protein
VADIEELARAAVDWGYKVHKGLGPGLLESVYETMLAASLSRAGLHVEKQKPIPIFFDGITIEDAFRADLVVEGRLVIEIKSLERLAPVHAKQLLTYIRLMEQPVGLLMNFGCETFREGIKRVVNGPSAFIPAQPRPR